MWLITPFSSFIVSARETARRMPQKGLLLGSTLSTLASATMSSRVFRPVDNLLGAVSMARQRAKGAVPLRVECDFVTCSQ